MFAEGSMVSAKTKGSIGSLLPGERPCWVRKKLFALAKYFVECHKFCLLSQSSGIILRLRCRKRLLCKMDHLERSALAMSLHLLIKVPAGSNRCDRSDVVEMCQVPNESLLKIILELPQKATNTYIIYIYNIYNLQYLHSALMQSCNPFKVRVA